MLRTIVVGTCVMVQGIFVRQFDSGRISVRVGQSVFTGFPVPASRAA